MQTIFITLNRGITNRNILRTGVLDKLAADKNRRIIILLQNPRNLPVPEYFLNEFAKENVIIEVTETKNLHGWERLFVGQSKRLTFSKSTRLNMLHNIKDQKRKGRLAYLFLYLIFAPLSKMNWVKKLARKLDLWLFRNHDYEKYFDKYKPDLVFITSIINYFDVDIMKEAVRRGIKTVAMPRSWDNIDKFLYRSEPDILLVQNEKMAEEAGRKVMELVWRDLRTRDIMTPALSIIQ